MRPQPITIHLGGEDWRVRPLTLAQIQRIEPLLSPEAQRSGASIAAASEIIMVALERDHPQAAQNLHATEATATEIAAVMRAVLQLAGFIAAEPSPGEEQAGAEQISR